MTGNHVSANSEMAWLKSKASITFPSAAAWFH